MTISRGAVILAALIWLLLPSQPAAHDMKHPELSDWYTTLRSGKGPCCDGTSKETVHLTPDQWRIVDGHYQVYINQHMDGSGQSLWVTVPDDAIVHQSNLAGEAIVWPVWGSEPWVRCFLPGDLS